jgi:hypothetical protein
MEHNLHLPLTEIGNMERCVALSHSFLPGQPLDCCYELLLVRPPVDVNEIHSLARELPEKDEASGKPQRIDYCIWTST